MTLQEFHDKCAHHDWFYDFSDSHSVWQDGRANAMALIAAAKANGPEFVRLYQDWCAHVFSGPPFDTEKLPPPPRPEAS